MKTALSARIESAAGSPPIRWSSLAGGCIAEVHRIDLADGQRLAAKVSAKGGLALEAFMLRYLASHGRIPVPEVLIGDDDLLVMTFVESGDALSDLAQEHAADLVAALHDRTAESFGFECDTLIGPLPQPNPPNESWLAFFRDHRLLYLGRLALESGRLPLETWTRLERLCGKLDRYIDEPKRPSLVHGDLWGGNVLAHKGRIAAFIDPAIYFADPEIELAFSTLFGTFGQPFFARYQEHRPLAPGFFELRRDLYNLYPLLVHTRLFGGHYAGSVAGILDRLV